jgi:hypothetical protein
MCLRSLIYFVPLSPTFCASQSRVPVSRCFVFDDPAIRAAHQEFAILIVRVPIDHLVLFVDLEGGDIFVAVLHLKQKKKWNLISELAKFIFIFLNKIFLKLK